MFHLFPGSTRNLARISRRQWLKMSAMASTSVAGMLNRHEAAGEIAFTGNARAKQCIYIFLCGGPSQPDLWDLKPEAPLGVRSEFSSIQTSIPGLRFGELIPRVSAHADKLALIRSMTHANNDHSGAIVHSLLGQNSAPPGQLYISRSDHPGLGAILHHALGPTGEIPPWVVLPRYFGTNSPPYKGQSAGFLGAAYDPLPFDKEKKGSLTDAPLKLGTLDFPQGLDGGRLSQRRALTAQLEQPLTGGAIDRNAANFDQAYELLTSDKIRQTFDLEREPETIRDRYGRNEYGQSFLMARRLVEAGVRFVNLFWTFYDQKGCQFNLWDNHGVPNDVCGIDGQLTGRQQLTHTYCTPSFDHSFSALLEDLSQRGLLDETLVVVAGEFGRTPKINKTAGRDHWAHCYTQLLAGGGVQGGAIWGASDAQGAFVKDAPVTPDDFAATVLHAFGVEREHAIPDGFGRPVRVTTGTPVAEIF